MITVVAAFLLIVATIGTWGAAGWIGQPFPGFLLLGNGVIASASGPGWPATEDGAIYQHEILAVDGVPLVRPADLAEIVRGMPVGSPITYTLRTGERETQRTIPSRRFGVTDFTLLFGTYLLNGIVLGAVALAILMARGRETTAAAVVPFLLVSAGFGLSAMDLYGPARLFRLHALCESILWAAVLHLALFYPQPVGALRRRPALVVLPYAVAAVFAIVYQQVLMLPARYVVVHLIATSALGASLLVLTASLVLRYLLQAAPEIRAHLKVLALGAALTLTPVILLTVAEPFTGGSSPANAIGFTSFLFFLSLGYAALTLPHDGGRFRAR